MSNSIYITLEMVKILHNDGYYNTKIAKKLNCSIDIVINRLKKLNLTPNKLNNITLEMVNNLHRKGQYVAEIAKNLNCSTDIIKNRLFKLNLIPNEKINENKNIILKSQKLTAQEISKKYNIPISIVYDTSSKNNIKLLSSKNKSIELVLKHYNNGMSVREIQNEINLGVSQISNILHKLKLPLIKKNITRNHPNRRIDFNVNNLIDDYKKGMRIQDIKLKYNCTNNVIYKRLKDNNIKPIGNSLGLDDEFIKLYTSGKSTCYISNKYNCDPTTISNVLIKNNIKRDNIYSESSIETKVKEILEKNNIKFIQNDRSILSNNKELDFYLPNHNLGIEVNGLYWHSEKYRHKNYHYNKYTECKQNNIQLLQFWEDDVNNKINIIENIILAKCKLNKKSIYARKCKIMDVNSKVASEFHNKYHIQGASKYSISKALIYNDDIVAIMSFKKRNEQESELVRYSSKYRVVGGASKILSKINKDIITFSDNCISDGNMYGVLKFNQVKDLNPDYKYLINGELVHKFNYRKMKFKKDDSLKYDENMTESQLAKLNNILKVYDAGKIKWKLINNE